MKSFTKQAGIPRFKSFRIVLSTSESVKKDF